MSFLGLSNAADRASTRGGRASLARWIVVVTIGEALGFAIAGIVAVASTSAGIPDSWRYVAIIAGGAAEGATLGAAQLVGMGARRPRLAPWIGATATGAAIAWSLGMLPSTVSLDLGSPLGIAAMAIGAVILLSCIPVAQWVVIRRRAGALRWIPVNMGAWAVAILWTFAPSPWIDSSTPVGVIVTTYTFAGLLMAATVAALTATTARALFA